jgi:hypothetical protein
MIREGQHAKDGKRTRRYRITEGSEEIQMRRIAQVMFGFGRPRE